jgi:hypothetical protein
MSHKDQNSGNSPDNGSATSNTQFMHGGGDQTESDGSGGDPERDGRSAIPEDNDRAD